MRPSRQDTLMDMALVVSRRSTCSRRQVGAIIARDFRPIVSGYNGAPAGMPHCNHRQDEPKHQGCTQVVHAEANAVAFAARHGVSTQGATLYVSLSPCEACAKLIINAGISRVVYYEEYRDPAGIDLLKAARIDVCQLI